MLFASDGGTAVTMIINLVYVAHFIHKSRAEQLIKCVKFLMKVKCVITCLTCRNIILGHMLVWHRPKQNHYFYVFSQLELNAKITVPSKVVTHIAIAVYLSK